MTELDYQKVAHAYMWREGGPQGSDEQDFDGFLANIWDAGFRSARGNGSWADNPYRSTQK